MNPMEAYGSPTAERPASRYRDDDRDRGDAERGRGDTYRRRSPRKSTTDHFNYILTKPQLPIADADQGLP